MNPGTKTARDFETKFDQIRSTFGWNKSVAKVVREAIVGFEQDMDQAMELKGVRAFMTNPRFVPTVLSIKRIYRLADIMHALYTNFPKLFADTDTINSIDWTSNRTVFIGMLKIHTPVFKCISYESRARGRVAYALNSMDQTKKKSKRSKHTEWWRTHPDMTAMSTAEMAQLSKEIEDGLVLVDDRVQEEICGWVFLHNETCAAESEVERVLSGMLQGTAELQELVKEHETMILDLAIAEDQLIRLAYETSRKPGGVQTTGDLVALANAVLDPIEPGPAPEARPRVPKSGLNQTVSAVPVVRSNKQPVANDKFANDKFAKNNAPPHLVPNSYVLGIPRVARSTVAAAAAKRNAQKDSAMTRVMASVIESLNTYAGVADVSPNPIDIPRPLPNDVYDWEKFGPRIRDGTAVDDLMDTTLTYLDFEGILSPSILDTTAQVFQRAIPDGERDSFLDDIVKYSSARDVANVVCKIEGFCNHAWYDPLGYLPWSVFTHWNGKTNLVKNVAPMNSNSAIELINVGADVTAKAVNSTAPGDSRDVMSYSPENSSRTRAKTAFQDMSRRFHDSLVNKLKINGDAKDQHKGAVYGVFAIHRMAKFYSGKFDPDDAYVKLIDAMAHSAVDRVLKASDEHITTDTLDQLRSYMKELKGNTLVRDVSSEKLYEIALKIKDPIGSLVMSSEAREAVKNYHDGTKEAFEEVIARMSEASTAEVTRQANATKKSVLQTNITSEIENIDQILTGYKTRNGDNVEIVGQVKRGLELTAQLTASINTPPQDNKANNNTQVPDLPSRDDLTTELKDILLALERDLGAPANTGQQGQRTDGTSALDQAPGPTPNNNANAILDNTQDNDSNKHTRTDYAASLQRDTAKLESIVTQYKSERDAANSKVETLNAELNNLMESNNQALNTERLEYDKNQKEIKKITQDMKIYSDAMENSKPGTTYHNSNLNLYNASKKPLKTLTDANTAIDAKRTAREAEINNLNDEITETKNNAGSANTKLDIASGVLNDTLKYKFLSSDPTIIQGMFEGVCRRAFSRFREERNDNSRGNSSASGLSKVQKERLDEIIADELAAETDCPAKTFKSSRRDGLASEIADRFISNSYVDTITETSNAVYGIFNKLLVFCSDSVLTVAAHSAMVRDHAIAVSMADEPSDKQGAAAIADRLLRTKGGVYTAFQQHCLALDRETLARASSAPAHNNNAKHTADGILHSGEVLGCALDKNVTEAFWEIASKYSDDSNREDQHGSRDPFSPAKGISSWGKLCTIARGVGFRSGVLNYAMDATEFTAVAGRIRSAKWVKAFQLGGATVFTADVIRKMYSTGFQGVGAFAADFGSGVWSAVESAGSVAMEYISLKSLLTTVVIMAGAISWLLVKDKGLVMGRSQYKNAGNRDGNVNYGLLETVRSGSARLKRAMLTTASDAADISRIVGLASLSSVVVMSQLTMAAECASYAFGIYSDAFNSGVERIDETLPAVTASILGVIALGRTASKGSGDKYANVVGYACLAATALSIYQYSTGNSALVNAVSGDMYSSALPTVMQGRAQLSGLPGGLVGALGKDAVASFGELLVSWARLVAQGVYPAHRLITALGSPDNKLGVIHNAWPYLLRATGLDAVRTPLLSARPGRNRGVSAVADIGSMMSAAGNVRGGINTISGMATGLSMTVAANALASLQGVFKSNPADKWSEIDKIRDGMRSGKTKKVSNPQSNAYYNTWDVAPDNEESEWTSTDNRLYETTNALKIIKQPTKLNQNTNMPQRGGIVGVSFLTSLNGDDEDDDDDEEVDKDDDDYKEWYDTVEKRGRLWASPKNRASQMIASFSPDSIVGGKFAHIFNGEKYTIRPVLLPLVRSADEAVGTTDGYPKGATKWLAPTPSNDYPLASGDKGSNFTGVPVRCVFWPRGVRGPERFRLDALRDYEDMLPTALGLGSMDPIGDAKTHPMFKKAERAFYEYDNAKNNHTLQGRLGVWVDKLKKDNPSSVKYKKAHYLLATLASRMEGHTVDDWKSHVLEMLEKTTDQDVAMDMIILLEFLLCFFLRGRKYTNSKIIKAANTYNDQHPKLKKLDFIAKKLLAIDNGNVKFNGQWCKDAWKSMIRKTCVQSTIAVDKKTYREALKSPGLNVSLLLGSNDTVANGDIPLGAEKFHHHHMEMTESLFITTNTPSVQLAVQHIDDEPLSVFETTLWLNPETMKNHLESNDTSSVPVAARCFAFSWMFVLDSAGAQELKQKLGSGSYWDNKDRINLYTNLNEKYEENILGRPKDGEPKLFVGDGDMSHFEDLTAKRVDKVMRHILEDMGIKVLNSVTTRHTIAVVDDKLSGSNRPRDGMKSEDKFHMENARDWLNHRKDQAKKLRDAGVQGSQKFQ